MITSYSIFVPAIMGNGASYQTGLKARSLGCKKVLVVYDKGLKDVGIADHIVQNIKNAGIETVIFDKVLPDPPDVVVEEGAELARSEKIDGIVAVGGGSSIDTAKGINVLINNPPPLMKYIGFHKEIKNGVPMIFIPTTSGTGSEVTTMCVISFMSLNKKDSVVSPVCVGTLAILDPELTLGLPPKMTAATGADALSHAIEAMTGGHTNPLSDALGLQATRDIIKWLPIAYKDGKNLKAREHMLYASMFAGMTFTNAFVHNGHAMAHVLGNFFHIPHGVGCAIALPGITEWTAVSEWEKVAMICECFGVDVPANSTPEQIGLLAKNAIRSFLKSIGIPNFKELGLKLEDVLKTVPAITADGAQAAAPYKLSTAKAIEILTEAYDA